MTQSFPPPHLKRLISPEEIAQKVAVYGKKITQEYQGRSLVIVALLKGAFPLLADLIRQIALPLEIGFLQASSYGQRGTKRGELTLYEVGSLDLKGKELLIVDDIFDSGATLEKVATHLSQQQPASLKSLVLLTKKNKIAPSFSPTYALFEIEDDFVVGYGLDYKELYRNLSGIYRWGSP